MERFKQIMLFVLLMILFAIFTDYMVKVGLRNTYKTMTGEIKTVSPEITIIEAKTTDVNGYVNGKIKNNSGEDIKEIDIKLELYSKRNVNLGTENLKITDLKNNEEKEFSINFRYSNVNKYKIEADINKE